MKKYLSIMLFLCLILLVATGCSSSGATQLDSNYPEIQNSSTTEPKGVDIDLTVLGSTMLSAELSNIGSNISKYLGKTIRISGIYSSFYYEETDKIYFNVITYMDPTMCCSEGMEFIWNGDHNYPDDYPAEDSAIEVIGVLGSYEELGIRYCYLAIDEIAIPS